MDEIWPEGKTRAELEERIFELANSIPLENSDWLYSEQLDQFIHAWYTLAKYYEVDNDTVIGVETVSEYVDFVRPLRRQMCDSTLDPNLRQQAEDKMSDLDAMMDEVIKEAVSHLNN
jgi:hypothetical protein